MRDFLYLDPDEDQSRVLEALWRCVRREFKNERFPENIQSLDQNVIPIVQSATELESSAISVLGLSGINFEEEEHMVRNLEGLVLLLKSAKEVQTDSSDNIVFITAMYSLFLSQVISETSSGTRKISPLINRAQTAIAGLEQATQNLRKNYLEYHKAVEFTGITEENIGASIKEITSLSGSPTLEELIKEVDDVVFELDSLSRLLGSTDEKLEQIKEQLGTMTDHDD